MARTYNRGSIRDWLIEKGWQRVTENFFIFTRKDGSKISLVWTNGKCKSRPKETRYEWRIYPDYTYSPEYIVIRNVNELKEYLTRGENGNKP